MSYQQEENSPEKIIGNRAEEVAQWYFRLNGFFLMPGFIVHPDVPMRTPRTEADVLGIRLKGSSEGVWRRPEWANAQSDRRHAPMKDDDKLLAAGKDGTVAKHLIAMVEVKAGRCQINGPWTDGTGLQQGTSNMHRCLARVGFANKTEVDEAAKAMYQSLRYVGREYIVQYFAVGKVASTELQTKYPDLVELTDNDIGAFLYKRFSSFPEKIPSETEITLWNGFGDKFRWWFEGMQPRSPQKCVEAVRNYIDRGDC